MANYVINIADNGDGSYSLSAIFRGPTAFGSGATNLCPVRSGGDAVGETTGWTYGSNGILGGFVGNIAEVAYKILPILAADTSLNGR